MRDADEPVTFRIEHLMARRRRRRPMIHDDFPRLGSAELKITEGRQSCRGQKI